MVQVYSMIVRAKLSPSGSGVHMPAFCGFSPGLSYVILLIGASPSKRAGVADGFLISYNSMMDLAPRVSTAIMRQ